MGRDAWYPQTSAFLRRDTIRQGSDLIERHNGKLGRRAEGTIGLRAVTPDPAPDPLGRYPLPNMIHLPGAITMRNDPRICHAITERVLTFLDISGIYAGCGPHRLRVEDRASRQPPTHLAPAPASRTKLPSSTAPFRTSSISSPASFVFNDEWSCGARYTNPPRFRLHAAANHPASAPPLNDPELKKDVRRPHSHTLTG
jgi:hypothetical protein